MIGRLILLEPKFLILDEPLQGLIKIHWIGLKLSQELSSKWRIGDAGNLSTELGLELATEYFSS